LQTKYGKGTSSETFIAPYIEGDGREKEALRSDKINYITSWKSTGGEIRIYLLPQYNVQIDYLDEANREVYENEVVETEND